MKKQMALGCMVCLWCVGMVSAAVCTFDDLTVAEGQSYWNGSDGSGGFTDGDAYYPNSYDDTYGPYWQGFSYSKVNDTTTASYTNQYAAITGTDVSGTGNYAVGYYTSAPTLSFGAVTGEDYNAAISGAYFTNTTYAYLSMANGDAYAKKFGGETGDDPDYLKLIIKGIDDQGEYTGTVDFYLADFRDADNSVDYIADEWAWVDLSGLGNVVGLEFSMESSDVGVYGMNTPAYFAMDNLTMVPEPATITILGLGLFKLLRKRK